MNIERAKRYRGKLGQIKPHTGKGTDIEEWANIDVPDFVSDKKTRLAVYKAFQELTEASFDVVAMACKDAKIIPIFE